MRKFMFLALLVAAPVFGQNQTADLLTAAGCGSARIQFDVKTDRKEHVVTQPEPGKALVYVIEDEKSDPHYTQIGHITTRVGLDGNWVGANHEESYMSFAVEPGAHRVCSDVQSKFVSAEKLSGAADLIAEAGKTYFYRVAVTPGAEDHDKEPRLWLKAVDEPDGLLLISKFALSASKSKR
jgi:hypothetical protein